ncbi:hypothetical protein EYC84_010550 [Monilinia fructicola]|uniref:Uncharacterized protein n=1 Tax=Monilinia fructicola TaxID=38448 RepID=A0A5M9J5P2_MONFR|nr:hypothetical protein EYC84_010550 [Monilinia fructicola]
MNVEDRIKLLKAAESFEDEDFETIDDDSSDSWDERILDVAGMTKVGRSSERNDELEEKRDWEEYCEVLSKVGTGSEPEDNNDVDDVKDTCCILEMELELELDGFSLTTEDELETREEEDGEDVGGTTIVEDWDVDVDETSVEDEDEVEDIASVLDLELDEL